MGKMDIEKVKDNLIELRIALNHLYGIEKVPQIQHAIDAIDKMHIDFKKYIESQVKKTRGVYACYLCNKRFPDPETFCADDECDGVSKWEYGDPRKKENCDD